jgi:hypothetical protein
MRDFAVTKSDFRQDAFTVFALQINKSRRSVNYRLHDGCTAMSSQESNRS